MHYDSQDKERMADIRIREARLKTQHNAEVERLRRENDELKRMLEHVRLKYLQGCEKITCRYCGESFTPSRISATCPFCA